MEDIKEKTADEMMEELGYKINDYSNEINKEDELYANYVYEIRKRIDWQNPQWLYKEIAFYPNIKKIEVYVDEKFTIGKDSLWTVEEIQAINKKCKELGWI